MPYILREVAKNERPMFAQIIRVLWTSSHHPYQPFFSAYNPVFGPTAEDREQAVDLSIERKWKQHVNDPTSHWIYVVDSEKPEVMLGICHWLFFLENPYQSDGPLPYDASMWPEGTEGRKFVEMMAVKQSGHRPRWLRRKHAVCHDMAVLPKHRNRGIASKLMEWGMNRAEELSLEVFLHGSDEGRFLYEKWGLRVLQKIELDMTVQNPSDEWEKLRHELGPLRFSFMWKPHGGIYEEGVTKLPWEIAA